MQVLHGACLCGMIAVMDVDYSALGFQLTTPDVAEILGKTEAEVRDLVRAGMLPFLARWDGPTGPVRLWFHPEEVAGLEVALRASVRQGGGLAVDHRNRLRTMAALRAYLEAHAPQASYDEAMLRNAPLWGRTRNGAQVVHVRADAVASFGSTLDAVPVTKSMVVAALEFVGAVRVRGVTALEEPGTQRWGVWFRLPPGVFPEDEGETVAAVVNGGAREEGERVSRRGGGPAFLAEPLRTDDPID